MVDAGSQRVSRHGVLGRVCSSRRTTSSCPTGPCGARTREPRSTTWNRRANRWRSTGPRSCACATARSSSTGAVRTVRHGARPHALTCDRDRAVDERQLAMPVPSTRPLTVLDQECGSARRGSVGRVRLGCFPDDGNVVQRVPEALIELRPRRSLLLFGHNAASVPYIAVRNKGALRQYAPIGARRRTGSCGRARCSRCPRPSCVSVRHAFA